MPGLLPPAVQSFAADAVKWVAGIDEMIAADDRLIESIAQVDEVTAKPMALASVATDTAAGAEAGAAGAEAGVGADDATAEAATAAAAAQKGLNTELAATGEIAGAVAGSEAEVAAGLKAAGDAAAEAAAKAGVYTDASGRMRDANGKFVASAEGAGAAAKGTGAKAEAASGGFGRYKMAAIGVALAVGLAVAGAAKFQEETTRLVTSAGESASNLGMVREGMLSISAATATSTAQMADGMYLVESAGFHGAAGLVVLKAAAQGAKDEGADLATVANGVTDALVDYHLPASDAAKVTSQLIAGVSRGKTTFQEFSSSLSNVLPTASVLHLKLADVSGVLAEMTAHGMSARRASQDEANAMRSLMDPTAAMGKEFSLLGISTNQVMGKLGKVGLSGTMQWLSGVAKDGSKAVGQNYTQALAKLMGTAPGLVTALMTTGENAKATDKAIKGIASASADAKGNVDGFSTVSQTLAFKMAAAKDSMKAAGITLGMALLPAVTAILGPITRMLQLIAGNKVAAAAFAVIVGGVLAGALGMKLVGAFGDARKGLEFLSNDIPKLAVKMGLLTAATDAQTAAQDAATGATEATDAAMAISPIGLIIIAIVALVAAFAILWTHSAAFRNFWISAWHDIVKVTEDVWHDIVKVTEDAWHHIEKPAKEVFNWIKHNWPLLLGVLLGPIALAAALIYMHWHQVQKIFEDFAGPVIREFGKIKNFISGSFDSWWKTNGDTVKQVWHELWTVISVVFHAVWDFIAAAVRLDWEIIQVAFSAGSAVLLAVWHLLWTVISAVFHAAWDLIAPGVRIGWAVTIAVFKIGMDVIVAAWKVGWAVLLAALKIIWAAIQLVVKVAWDVIVGIFTVALDLVTGKWGRAWTEVQLVATQAWNAIEAFFRSWWSAVTGLFTASVHAVESLLRSAWGTITGTAVSAWNILLGFFRSIWHGIVSGAQAMTGNLIVFFENLPAEIWGALSQLAHWLWQAGVNAMQSLINGLMSQLGNVGSAVSGIASKVAGFFGLSPAKEGPLAGSGAPEARGAHFAAAMATGMLSGKGSVAAAAGRLALAAGLTPTGGLTPAAGGGPASAWGGGQGGQQTGTLNLTIQMQMPSPSEWQQFTQKYTLRYNRRNMTNGLTLITR